MTLYMRVSFMLLIKRCCDVNASKEIQRKRTLPERRAPSSLQPRHSDNDSSFRLEE